jgi:uncharacterized membrane protein
VRQRLTNTWIHALIGLLAGAVVHFFIRIFGVYDSLAVFSMISFGLITVVWEYNQYDGSSDYLKRRWLDTAVDLLSANVLFIAMLLLKW